MRKLHRITGWLILVAILIPISSTHARLMLGEPAPADKDTGMRALSALLTDQPHVTPLSIDASTGPITGTYAAVFAADVRQGSPSTNYATQNHFHVGQYGGVMRGLLLFDLSALPPSVTINSAALQVYVVESYDYPHTARTITAHRISSWWTEFLATWNSAPTFAESYGSASVGHEIEVWHSLDVTALVRAWLAGTYPNYGIMLRGSEDIAYRAFASEGTAYPPRLVINYSLPPQALEVLPASLEFAIGSVSGVSPTYTLLRDAQPLAISGTTTDVLHWSATNVYSAPWLRLDRDSGLFSVAEPDVIQISVMTDTLTSKGVYTGQIQVNASPVVQGSPRTINVTFQYTDGLHLNFLPAVLKNRTFSPHDYHTVALLIGIADYIYLPPAISALSDSRQPPKSSDVAFAGGDAHSLFHMSIDKGHECFCCGDGESSASGETISLPSSCGGGFRENNTLLLTEWRATKAAIREAFQWLDLWEREDTLVLIVFSGHGGYIEDTSPLDEADGYDELIVAAESGGTSDMAGVILDDELARWLDELESNYVVVVVDSCFSGGMIDSQASSPSQQVRTIMPQSDVHLMAGDGFVQDISGPGRLIITASSETQPSWEFGALESGALSYFLIEALLTPAADKNGDGWISFEEAFNYAAPLVDSYVYGHTVPQVHQNPQMLDGIDGDVKWVRP